MATASLKVAFRVDRRFWGKVERSGLRKAMVATFRSAGVTNDGALTLVVTGNEEIQSMNRDYRGVDAITDVLAFGNSGTTDSDGFSEDGPRYLGDIVIAFPRAAEQAAAENHPVEEELWLLAVHGLLHLLGHDHDEPDEQQRMWLLQDAVLAKLGVPWRP